MIDGIKGSCQIKEANGSGLISIDSAEKVVVESKKRSLSGVICAIGRLTIRKKVESPEMSRELAVDYTFNQLRKKGESSNRPMVGEILRVKSRLLDEGCDDSMLQGGRKAASSDG